MWSDSLTAVMDVVTRVGYGLVIGPAWATIIFYSFFFFLFFFLGHVSYGEGETTLARFVAADRQWAWICGARPEPWVAGAGGHEPGPSREMGPRLLRVADLSLPAREFCELGPRGRGETLGPCELGVAGMSIPAR
jgi:hypothetical protein